MEPFAYLTGRNQPPRPPAIGTKFDPSGAPLQNPGNTVIYHIDPASDAHAALTALQSWLRAAPSARFFTFLPPSSFHMTLFEGVIEHARHTAPWPEGIARDAPLEHVTATLRTRLPSAPLGRGLRIHATGLFAGFSLRVTGFDAADEAALRAARDSLAAALGVRRESHARYAFHITLAYVTQWLPASEAEAVIALSDAAFAEVAPRLQSIALGQPEFTRFDTMHRFDVLDRL